MRNAGSDKAKTNAPASKWLVFRTGAGQITGYVEAFMGSGGKYVTVPGASRFRDALGKEYAPPETR